MGHLFAGSGRPQHWGLCYGRQIQCCGLMLPPLDPLLSDPHMVYLTGITGIKQNLEPNFTINNIE